MGAEPSRGLDTWCGTDQFWDGIGRQPLDGATRKVHS